MTETNDIFIANFDNDVTESDLQEFFEKEGLNPIRIVVLRDRETGASRNFGFAKFSDEQEVSSALRLNGKLFRGRNLRVDKARPRA